MPAITVRGLSEETHRALKARAAAHGRSTEAEVRSILDSAVSDETQLGSLLSAIGAQAGGLELEHVRDDEGSAPPDLS